MTTPDAPPTSPQEIEAQTAEAAEPVELKIRVDVRKITYGDFRLLLKIQSGNAEPAGVFDIFDKAVYPDDIPTIERLPAVDVIPILVKTVKDALQDGLNRKN